jgi:hypothetical protein
MKGQRMRIYLKFLSIILMSIWVLYSCGGGGSDNEFTGGPPQNIPELTDVDPPANDSSVAVGSAITAFFDRNMEPATADSFVVYGSFTGKLDGDYFGGGSDTLQFKLLAGSAFKFGEEVEVILTDLLASTDGVFFEPPFVYRFRAEARGGSGDFTSAGSVAGQVGTRALAAGDWDGNGDLDLASANFGVNTVDVLKNQP